MTATARDLSPLWELDEGQVSTALLQRWVRRPDGSLELLEMPLTPELFLNPRLGDKMLQGQGHSNAARDLVSDLSTVLRSERDDVLVLWEVKHGFGIPGLPFPAPDVSVVYGVRRRKDEDWPESFRVRREGTRPSLLLEVLSPRDPRLRKVDLVDKVEIYQRAGIPEYLLVDTPRRRNGYRFQLKGYRLDSQGLYHPIQPDPEGRLFSERTRLWFTVSPEGDRVVLVNAATGKVLLSRREQAEALKAAEAEISWLREQLERLRKPGT